MANDANNFPNWLLIANGAPVADTKLRALAVNKKVLVLDGAYQLATQAKINIDVLLGDFDSIEPVALQQVRDSHIQVIDAPDQNKTDLEKGLLYIDQFNPCSIFIVAATGLRLQHTLFNLRILKKYYQLNRELVLISDEEIIRYYQDTQINIDGEINDCVAILGFPYATITTSGLKYDVNSYPLQFENGNSISNALSQSQANIIIQGDVLVIHEQVSDGWS